MGTEFHDDWTSVPFLVSPISHLLTFVLLPGLIQKQLQQQKLSL